MRTTLTLDDDVAVALDRIRKERAANLKEVVNEALRRGLRHLEEAPKPRKPFRLPTRDLGDFLIDVTNSEEALSIAEGDGRK